MHLVKADDPVLRKVCRSDFTISLDDIKRMLHLLHDVGGLALAAPQIGIDARFFVTSWAEVFVNPKIVGLAKPIHSIEGCLSLPGVSVRKARWNRILLADGRVFYGEQAIVIQHEVDHLNGRLISDA